MITTGGIRQQVLAHAHRREHLVVAEAVAQERQRVAAEVHDLIMQDLAFALATSRTLAGDPRVASQASVIVEAAERALAGARGLIAGLVEGQREPVVDAVEASARKAARNVPLSFDASGVPVGEQPDPPTLDTLVHIGREAVTNAVKHASPESLEVVLERADEWQLLIRDDGRGFNAGGERTGFGLPSMSQQALALGGWLRVSSTPGAGTTVRASLP